MVGILLHSCKTQSTKTDITKTESEKAEKKPKKEVSEPQLPKSIPDHIVYGNEFVESWQAWSDFKQSANNNYEYQVADGSWSGLSWETTITIENGEVIKRSFKYTSTKDLPQDIPAEELEWTEQGDEIGTNKMGASPLTLDEIYDKAQEEWLLKRDNSEAFFETENNGMISTCGYIINNCADDCFQGINIKNIEAI